MRREFSQDFSWEAALLIQVVFLTNEASFANHAGYITIISLKGDIGRLISICPKHQVATDILFGNRGRVAHYCWLGS